MLCCVGWAPHGATPCCANVLHPMKWIIRVFFLNHVGKIDESSEIYSSLWRWLQVCRSELHFGRYNRQEVDTNYRLLTLCPSKATSPAQVSFRKSIWKAATAKCVKWKIQLDAFSGQNVEWRWRRRASMKEPPDSINRWGYGRDLERRHR